MIYGGTFSNDSTPAPSLLTFIFISIWIENIFSLAPSKAKNTPKNTSEAWFASAIVWDEKARKAPIRTMETFLFVREKLLPSDDNKAKSKGFHEDGETYR
jgi:hypothetical protein